MLRLERERSTGCALLLLWPLWLAAGSGCTRPNPVESVATITPADKEEAARVFAGRCQTCHGATGQGDGPAGVALRPQPRNFQDAMWQSNVTDKHIETIIRFGGGAVGKSVIMPGNPDLISKPGVVAALRAQIRSLGK